jgi:Tfp pilus assembly protein PilN
MRAVNLIPAEEARSTSGGGHSGGAVYGVLAALALVVAMVGVWSWFGHAEKTRQAQVAQVQSEASSAEAKASGLKTYTDVATVRQARTETVRELASSRFDWPHALRDVARTMPSNAWITSLRATVSPQVSVDGTPDPLRQALTVPAIEVVGCARSQDDVATTVAAMRQVDGVQRVSLSSSSKQPGTGGGSCSDGDSNAPSVPQFSMTVFFKAPATGSTAPATAAATGGTTP